MYSEPFALQSADITRNGQIPCCERNKNIHHLRSGQLSCCCGGQRLVVSYSYQVAVSEVSRCRAVVRSWMLAIMVVWLEDSCPNNVWCPNSFE